MAQVLGQRNVRLRLDKVASLGQLHKHGGIKMLVWVAEISQSRALRQSQIGRESLLVERLLLLLLLLPQHLLLNFVHKRLKSFVAGLFVAATGSDLTAHFRRQSYI